MSEKSVNLQAWGQAFRVVIAATVTTLTILIYTLEIQKRAFGSGVKVGYTQGAAQCYIPKQQGSRFENTFTGHRDSTPQSL